MNLPKGAFPLTLAVRRLKVSIENTACGNKTPTYRKKKSYKVSLGSILQYCSGKHCNYVNRNYWLHVWLQRPLPSCLE